VAVLQAPPGAAAGGAPPAVEIGRYLRRSVRTQDVVGLDGRGVALMLPDTDSVQAGMAATRLLGVARVAAGGAGAAWGCGVATVYGQVEGGSEALIAAAQEAIRDARPGEVRASGSLRGRPRVLVIDDDRTFCQALADTVSELGWDGFPCSDVADAFTRVKDDDFAGLIVDLCIPGTSGVALLREALARRKHLPALLVSGKDASGDQVMEALALGPVTFMRKPFPRTEIEAALRMFRGALAGVRASRVSPHP
jgi:ActR/RegA family two-component response regulator